MLNLNFLVMLAIFFPLFIPNVNSFIHVRNRNPHCSRCDDCYMSKWHLHLPQNKIRKINKKPTNQNEKHSCQKLIIGFVLP